MMCINQKTLYYCSRAMLLLILISAFRIEAFFIKGGLSLAFQLAKPGLG